MQTPIPCPKAVTVQRYQAESIGRIGTAYLRAPRAFPERLGRGGRTRARAAGPDGTGGGGGGHVRGVMPLLVWCAWAGQLKQEQQAQQALSTQSFGATFPQLLQ